MSCSVHDYTGNLPCPWPGCQTPEDMNVLVVPRSLSAPILYGASGELDVKALHRATWCVNCEGETSICYSWQEFNGQSTIETVNDRWNTADWIKALENTLAQAREYWVRSGRSVIEQRKDS